MPKYLFLPIEQGLVTGGILGLSLPDDQAAIETGRRRASSRRGCEVWKDGRLVSSISPAGAPPGMRELAVAEVTMPG